MFVIRVFKKINRLISNRQMRMIPLIFFLMIISALMEMCTVSLIIPFMNLVMKPDTLYESEYYGLVQEYFHIDSPNRLLCLIAIIMAVIYIFKNIFWIFEIWIQQKYIMRTMIYTQKSLLEGLLNMPYEFFLGTSSSEIHTLILSKTSSVFTMLTQLLNLCAETIVAGILTFTVFIITPRISLAMITMLFIILLFISKILKPILKKASFDAGQAATGLTRWVIQALQGIKEVKISRAENLFVNKYNEYGGLSAKANCRYVVLSNIPRALIESVSMSSFLILVSVYIFTGNQIGDIFPIIAAIAVAAVRLLPAANRISTSIATIAYTEPYLDEILELKEKIRQGQMMNENSAGSSTYIEEKEAKRRDEKYLFKKEIKIENITFHYPGSEDLVLENANLNIMSGESVGIVGTSGAGKTTLADIILGLLKPQDGTVKVDGVDIRDNTDQWISQIGYISQSIFMLEDTIRANISFGQVASSIDDKKVWDALEEAALDDFVRGLPDGLDTQIGENGMRLSGGQRQRIGIARALYKEPQILFFDEATSALDNETEHMVMESIRALQGKRTMVIIAHRLSTIESCDHVYAVENRKIVKKR